MTKDVAEGKGKMAEAKSPELPETPCPSCGSWYFSHIFRLAGTGNRCVKCANCGKTMSFDSKTGELVPLDICAS